MNRYDWKWYLKDTKPDKDVRVFSTFSCGGGSSMGYKRAGFQVIGNVEIDPRMNDIYVANNHPKYNFCMDLREFNRRDDLPEELFDIDILDGSPPCTSFSMAGVRENSWGKKKKFREGQAHQVLDDLFFVFLDTVEKLRPKIVIAENVVGLAAGNAKGYVNAIVKRFKDLGYVVQMFKLNSAMMDVPQARERVFFLASRGGAKKKISLDFHDDIIPFGQVRSADGVDYQGSLKGLLEQARPGDLKLAHITERMTGDKDRYYTAMILHDDRVAPTITSAGAFFRYADKMKLSDDDFRNVQSFPQDYLFGKNSAQYVCGMSVPPNMMANVATEVWEQWLS